MPFPTLSDNLTNDNELFIEDISSSTTISI